MRCFLFVILTIFFNSFCVGSDIRVAVAANFYETALLLIAEFEKNTGKKVQLISGSTGVHYAQISQGAPYDLFLAADESRIDKLLLQRPNLLNGVYAQGQLAYWNPNINLPDNITHKQWKTIAIEEITFADPNLAPYGLAASQCLNDRVAINKNILANNVVHAFQYVKLGAVKSGLVATSQLIHFNVPKTQWAIMPNCYLPINQKGMVLNERPGAVAFWRFVNSAKAQSIIKGSGYVVN